MATKEDKLDVTNLLCSPCKRKGNNTKAESYCTDCQDYYCSVCVKCHEDIPALSGHKIIGKEVSYVGATATVTIRNLNTDKTIENIVFYY